MKKYTLLALSLATIVGLVGLASCSKDDPAPRLKVSFEHSSETIDEGDGTATVNVILDQVAQEDITVEYDVDGTALEGSPSTAGSDYQITSDAGKVKIRKGEAVGMIELKLKDDAIFEGDETIEFSIKNVSSTNVDIGEDNTTTITLVENDSQPKVSFVATSRNVIESDHNIEIQVQLDNAPGTDVVINYTLSGTAIDSVSFDGTTATSDYDFPDYAIRSAVAGEDATPGQLVIKAGQTKGTIRLMIYSDFILEDAVSTTSAWDPETIVISLTQSAGVAVGANDKTTISIKQEDGKAVGLDWDPDYTTVDMDLKMYVLTSETGGSLIAQALNASFTGPEIVFIPKAFTEITFGLSYIYYEGDVTPMNFNVQFVDFVNLVFEPQSTRDVFDGQYTLANINKWDTSGQTPIIEQAFNIDADGNYDISDITIPDAGSRVGGRNLTIPDKFAKRKLMSIQTSAAAKLLKH